MKQLYKSINNLHFRINDSFKLPPLFSFALLMTYVIIVALISYLIGYDLLGQSDTSVTDDFPVLFLRTAILMLFINFNIVFLYFLVRWFRHKKVPLRVIYSYYAVFGTFLFLISIILFLSILFSYYVIGIQIELLVLLFGITILIILSAANLYPAYFLIVALKDEPVDVFWAIILCIIGIHFFSYMMFTLWNRIHIIQLWI